jgi:hypothetical protein
MALSDFVQALLISCSDVSRIMRLLTHNVRQSMMMHAEEGAFLIALVISKGSSIVSHFGRSLW